MSHRAHREPMMNLISTGVDGLDRILGGGLLEGNCVLVEGAPGTGKTTLGLQFVCQGAMAHGERGMVVTFEESPDQMIVDARQIGWDLLKLEDQGLIRMLCISPDAFHDEVLDEQGFMDLLKTELDVKRIMIDSTTHFQQITPHPFELRKLVFGLKNALRRLRMTSILVEEIEAVSGGYIPFSEYVVDTVLRLYYEPVDGGRGRARTVEVLKSRGQGHIGGRHAFTIREGGITVFPRTMPRQTIREKKSGAFQRALTGVSGMDDMLGGGLIRGFTTLVAGSTGTGKTTFGLQFLARGASLKEQGLLISFEERPGKIQRLASACGLDFAGGVESGRIRILHRPVAGLFFEEFLSDLEQEVSKHPPRRVVIDGLTDISLAIEPQSRLREALWALSSVLEPTHATVLMTSEIPDVVGQFSITDQHLSVLVDGIILLRYVEIDGEMQRAVSVLKMRGIDHDKNIRRFTIGDRGLEVGAMFEGHEGILGGVPHARDISMSLFSIDEEDQKVNAEIIARFTRLNPRVRVEPLVVSFSADEARDMVMNVLSSKTTDMGVVPVDVYWMPEMARQRMLQRLDHLFPPTEQQAFLDVAMRQCVHEGHVYGAPSFADVGTLLYRKDLLDKYGFAPPETWDELIHQSKAIMSGEGGEMRGFLFKGHECEGLSCSLLEYIWSSGADVAALTRQNLLNAMRFHRDLIHEHHVAPVSVTETPAGPDTYQEFVEGRAVFLRSWPHVMQIVEGEQSQVRGRVGIAQLPTGPRGRESHPVMGGWNLCIPLHTKSPTAAWSFIRYSTSYECQKLKAIRGGPLPALKSLYSDPDVLRSKPYYSDLPRVFASAWFRQDIRDYTAISRLLQQRASAVLRGEVEPESAAEVLGREIAALREA